MGLARVRKPEGLVFAKHDRKCDRKTQFERVIQIGATHKCNQQVRLTIAINRYDSQVQSTGTTHKCD